jgi:signal transduction histidine kinase
LSADQQHAVDVLIGAYERLHRLLQQLIDLMHGHQIILRRQNVTAQELIQQAVTSVMPRATARSITLAAQLPPEPLPLEVDRSRCVLAFEYLIDNAVKFNHDQGRVEVEMTGTPEAVHVRIVDSGVGIPPAEIEKVFTPFYQLNQELSQTYEGAGIGLTLAKRYIELHGGSLQLSSELGKGTTVTVLLPRPATAVTLPQPASSTSFSVI